MKNPTYIHRIAGLIGAIAMSAGLMAASPASAEYACQNEQQFRSAAGTHYSQASASAIAKHNWKLKIRNRYGMEWSVWAYAKGKTLKCVSTGNGTKTCVARARACKYVTG